MSISITTRENITETDLHNLELLKGLLRSSHSLKPQALIIDDLFYWHVASSASEGEQVYLSSNDIYNLHELIKTLKNFKYEHKG